MSAILMMRKIGFLKPVLKVFTYLATFVSFVESKYLRLQLILKNDHASLLVQLRKVCVRTYYAKYRGANCLFAFLSAVKFANRK